MACIWDRSVLILHHLWSLDRLLGMKTAGSGPLHRLQCACWNHEISPEIEPRACELRPREKKQFRHLECAIFLRLSNPPRTLDRTKGQLKYTIKWCHWLPVKESFLTARQRDEVDPLNITTWPNTSQYSRESRRPLVGPIRLRGIGMMPPGHAVSQRAQRLDVNVRGARL
jgi:hypothetical protein